MSSAATPTKKEFLCILPDFPGAQAKRLEVRPWVQYLLVSICLHLDVKKEKGGLNWIEAADALEIADRHSFRHTWLTICF
jgi:hypothetical protein